MLASEAVTRIQRKLGYRTDKADEILEELIDTQKTLEQGVPSPFGKGTFIPWFLITEVASARTTIGEERLLLPTDFAGELEGFRLYYFDENAESDENAWVQLEKGEESFMRKNLPGSGAPAGYFYSGGYWRIRPTPDDEYLMKIIYAGADTTLTVSPNITNKWLTWAPWVLVSAAGSSMAQSLRDATALQFFQQRMALEVNTLWAATEARFQSNDRPVMGGTV